MWGDPYTEYADYCKFIIANIQKYTEIEVKTILDLGCGGGKNLINLSSYYAATGLDLSPQMLELARELNPDCELVRADMRNFELLQEYDAIFIDDAISYMTNRDDLHRVLIQTYKHLKPGGVMCVTPDTTTETFIQNQTTVFYSQPSEKYPDTKVVYIQNDYVSDPANESYDATFVYLIRKNGVLNIETDHHVLGIFPLQIWKDLLVLTGFDVNEETYDADEQQYISFICTKPLC
jgi:trans-aconitate methyltransferase